MKKQVDAAGPVSSASAGVVDTDPGIPKIKHLWNRNCSADVFIL
jgi:hypothetical protein